MEQEYYSKEDFVFYLYMRKSTKWNAKQADSLPKQDETAYFFIKENFSYLDYEKDIIKFEESATAFQDKKRKDWNWNYKRARIYRPNYTRMINSIKKMAKNGKKAILFIYDSSRLSRNESDMIEIKDMLGITLENPKDRTIEKIFFTSNWKSWDYKTENKLIRKELEDNIAFSEKNQENVIGANDRWLKQDIIPKNIWIHQKSTMENRAWIYYETEKTKYLVKGLELYKNWKTQKEVIDYLETKDIIITRWNFKAFFARPIFTGYYEHKRTKKVYKLKYATGRPPIPFELLECVEKRQNNLWKKYWSKFKWSFYEFIVELMETEEGWKVTLDRPKGKKAVYFRAKWKEKNKKIYANTQDFIRSLDEFEFLPKILFVYWKMYLNYQIKSLENDIENLANIEKWNKDTINFFIELLTDEINVSKEYLRKSFTDFKNDFLNQILEEEKNWRLAKMILERKEKENLNNIDFLKKYHKSYFKKIEEDALDNLFCKNNIKIIDFWETENKQWIEVEEIKESLKWKLGEEKEEIKNKLDFEIEKEAEKFFCYKKTEKERYQEMKNFIYEILYNYFKPYLKTEENKEDLAESKRNINKQIKELKEEMENKEMELMEKWFTADKIEKFLKEKYILEIERKEKIKKELEKQTLDFGNFQNFINSLENIFSAILKIDLKQIQTLTFAELIAKKLIWVEELAHILQNTTFKLFLTPEKSFKIEIFEVLAGLLVLDGTPTRSRT